MLFRKHENCGLNVLYFVGGIALEIRAILMIGHRWLIIKP
jgi:hypothetical protein